MDKSNAEKDSYSRKLTDSEWERMDVLREQYEKEGRFPEGKLSVVDNEGDAIEGQITFVTTTRTYVIPKEEMTDEQILQIIDYGYKEDYSLRQEHRGTQKNYDENVSNEQLAENDKKIIKEKLYSYEYDINSLNFNKITVDLNKDGNNEEIYIINNFNSIDTDNTIFNYVFMKKNDNTIIDIEKNENSSSEYYAVQNSSFLYATDIDNDNNYEIVLYSYYEESPAYCTIYKYDDLNNTVTKFE